MSIQKEKEMPSGKDFALIVRLASYAKPYWRMIIVCIMLVFLIVVAELARPYLIKISIDDFINGATKPMLAVSEENGQLLHGYGKPMYIDGMAYVRLSRADGLTDLQSTEGILKKQIVEIEGQNYLLDGWLPLEIQSPAVMETDHGMIVVAGGDQWSAIVLSGEQFQLFREKDDSGFILLGILFFMIILITSILNFYQTNLLQYTGQKIIYTIRKQLFHHLSRMSMSFFNRNPVGRLVVRLTSDTESVNQFYSQVIVNLVKDIVILLGIIILMLIMSVKLTLLTFLVIPILVVMTFAFKIIVRKAQRQARVLLSILNSYLAENLSGMRITQLFTRERTQFKRFAEHNQAYYRAGLRGTIINSIFQPAIGFMGHIATGLIIWYGGIQVIDGAITFGIVIAFTQYVTLFFKPLMSLAERYTQIQTALVGAERIFDMLDEQPEVNDSLTPKALPAKVKGEIVFDQVWFAYQGDNWVLKDISFTIKPGQSVAFVGATGAGKSSIIQLINRFYDIQKGSIKLDGIDIRDIPLKELRKCISIIQQDVFLFTGNIKENIRLHHEEISDQHIFEAASMVNMEGFVRNLPQQYDTELGERGVNLSLGQRQLLSFARAIVFKPQILILDEATSNIDTETELIVQDALRTVSKDKTTLIVAHRLSTIQHADQIIVMHKGRVKEMGNHQQLLERRGYYHRLFELQYKDQMHYA